MTSANSAVEMLVSSSNTLFILLGAIMVFAMHAGFAFLEVGTVRHKNQVNALVKIMTDFAVSPRYQRLFQAVLLNEQSFTQC